MTSPVCTVGSRFVGYCRHCSSTVGGTMVDGEFATIEGQNICVTGSIGRGDCGHSCVAVGQSAIWKIEGKEVARVGDPVTGDIEGKLTTGSDFVTSD